VLSELHATPIVGHSGFAKTYDQVKRSFFWEGMKQDIRKFIAECEVCQRNKGETVKSPAASDSPCYLEGYLYGLYYRPTQIEE
jgi:hypothetical protein